MRKIKQLICYFILCAIPFTAYAQEKTKIVYVKKAGSLISELTLQEANSLTELVVIGRINAVDFKNIRDDFKSLEVLDLSEADIRSYMGSNGTGGSSLRVYSANAIPEHAFSTPSEHTPVGKVTLREVTLPHSIRSINQFAFANCPQLQIINCKSKRPPSLKEGALSSQRTAIFVPAGSKDKYDNHKEWSKFAVIDREPLSLAVHVEKGQSLEHVLSHNRIQPKDINFLTLTGYISTNDMMLIRDYMANIVTIDLKNTDLVEIPEYTFAQKVNLLSIQLPSNLRVIGLRAFDNCNKLGPNLFLPETVTTLSFGAFNDCSSLESVIATGSNLTAISEKLFGERERNRIVYK